MVAEIDDPRRGHVVQMGIPFRFSKTPGAIKGLAPEPGGGTAVTGDENFARLVGEEMLRQYIESVQQRQRLLAAMGLDDPDHHVDAFVALAPRSL